MHQGRHGPVGGRLKSRWSNTLTQAESNEDVMGMGTKFLGAMGGNDPRYDAVPYTVHLHHNLFDQRDNTYAVELGTDKMVVDHNWFRNTWTALQNYGDSSTRIRDLTVFNNVVENLSMRFVGLKGRVENLRVFGNTVYLASGGGQSYLVTLGSNDASRNWLLANNAVVGSSGNPASSRQFIVAYQSSSAPRGVRIHNNVYRDLGLNVAINDTPVNPQDWDHVYAANLEADPGLSLTGDTAFQPGVNSPLLERGDSSLQERVRFLERVDARSRQRRPRVPESLSGASRDRLFGLPGTRPGRYRHLRTRQSLRRHHLQLGRLDRRRQRPPPVVAGGPRQRGSSPFRAASHSRRVLR
jgi:hypothetical protein